MTAANIANNDFCIMNLNSDEADDRQSGRLNGAGDLSVLSKIQERVLAEAVQPNSTPGVTVTDTHRDHSYACGTSVGVQGSGDALSRDAAGNLADRIGV